MVRQLRLLLILIIAPILASAASASDDTAPSTPPAAVQAQSAIPSTPGTATDGDQSGGDQSGGDQSKDKSQPPSSLDRRDRIFYPGDTERPKPLLRKLFLNIVFDQEDIFTSPFHVNRHNALEWLVPM